MCTLRASRVHARPSQQCNVISKSVHAFALAQVKPDPEHHFNQPVLKGFNHAEVFRGFVLNKIQMQFISSLQVSNIKLKKKTCL